MSSLIIIDLKELVSESEEDYIKKAVSYCADTDKIINLRKIIFDKALKSPLFDKEKFSNQFYTSLEK